MSIPNLTPPVSDAHDEATRREEAPRDEAPREVTTPKFSQPPQQPQPATLPGGIAKLQGFDHGGDDHAEAGQTEQVYNDLTFLGSDIALLRSKSIVRGQLHTDGEPMADRHNHHLWVFQRWSGQWVIVSHLISQANEHR